MDWYIPNELRRNIKEYIASPESPECMIKIDEKSTFDLSIKGIKIEGISREDLIELRTYINFFI